MPFWTRQGQTNRYKSKSCYTLVYSPTNVLVAHKRNTARWAGNNTKNWHTIINNQNEDVFPGGSLTFTSANPPTTATYSPSEVAAQEFYEECALSIYFVDANNASIYDENHNLLCNLGYYSKYFPSSISPIYCALYLQTTDTNLNNIQNQIQGLITSDNNIYGITNPPQQNGYYREDDEIFSVISTPRVNAAGLFGSPSQDWFLNILNNINP